MYHTSVAGSDSGFDEDSSDQTDPRSNASSQSHPHKFRSPNEKVRESFAADDQKLLGDVEHSRSSPPDKRQHLSHFAKADTRHNNLPRLPRSSPSDERQHLSNFAKPDNHEGVASAEYISLLIKSIPTLKEGFDENEGNRFLFALKLISQHIKNSQIAEEFIVAHTILKIEGALFSSIAAASPSTIEALTTEILWHMPYIRTGDVVKHAILLSRQEMRETPIEFIRRLEALKWEFLWAREKSGAHFEDQKSGANAVEVEMIKAIENGLKEPIGDTVRRRAFCTVNEIKGFVREEAARERGFIFFKTLSEATPLTTLESSQATHPEPLNTSNPPPAQKARATRSKRTARSAVWMFFNPNNFASNRSQHTFEAG